MPSTLLKWSWLVAVLIVTSCSASAAAKRWVTEVEPSSGYSFAYPAPVFKPLGSQGKRHFRYFGNSSDAKFVVGAWENTKGQTPGEFKRWLIENVGGYEELTYRPRGRSWFVMSGYRGQSIYYEKVMFSCGGQLVNVLAVTYPANQRGFYDQIVETMEDSFRPGRNCT
jgi:hypothetical protein